MNTQGKRRRARCIQLIAIVPLVLMFSETLPATIPADGLTKHFTGEILNVRAETIVLVNGVGKEHSFAVADDAMIMLNDTEASLDMLQPGLLATVNARSRGGEWVATSVHARQQY